MPLCTRHRETRWVLLPADGGAVRSLARSRGLHPVVARTLVARGLADGVAVDRFLDPRLMDIGDPFDLAEMSEAVARTLRGLRGGERLCVYGDYDADGVCSTALLVETLRFLGAEPHVVLPHRLRDGYGMNVRRVEEIAAAGVTLVITVDTGVSAIEPVARARELGIDVVVTDHHVMGEDTPAAVAIVNPNRPGAAYPGGAVG